MARPRLRLRLVISRRYSRICSAALHNEKWNWYRGRSRKICSLGSLELESCQFEKAASIHQDHDIHKPIQFFWNWWSRCFLQVWPPSSLGFIWDSKTVHLNGASWTVLKQNSKPFPIEFNQLRNNLHQYEAICSTYQSGIDPWSNSADKWYILFNEWFYSGLK